MRSSVTILTALALTATAALAGCATPEQLEAAEARRSAQNNSQTGSNIAKREHGATRVTGVGGRDSVDDTMRDLKLPERATMNAGGG